LYLAYKVVFASFLSKSLPLSVASHASLFTMAYPRFAAWVGKEITGKRFNFLLGDSKAIKFIRKNEPHHHMFYDTDGEYVPINGYRSQSKDHGIYFTLAEYITDGTATPNIELSDKANGNNVIFDVTIDSDEKVVIYHNRFRASRVTLSNERPFDLDAFISEEDQFQFVTHTEGRASFVFKSLKNEERRDRLMDKLASTNLLEFAPDRFWTLEAMLRVLPVSGEALIILKRLFPLKVTREVCEQAVSAKYPCKLRVVPPEFTDSAMIRLYIKHISPMHVKYELVDQLSRKEWGILLLNYAIDTQQVLQLLLEHCKWFEIRQAEICAAFLRDDGNRIDEVDIFFVNKCSGLMNLLKRHAPDALEKLGKQVHAKYSEQAASILIKHFPPFIVEIHPEKQTAELWRIALHVKPSMERYLPARFESVKHPSQSVIARLRSFVEQ
jgi:hypothetical protein